MLAACNQVYDLDATVLPHDAPFACPPIGTTPQFSPMLHQAVVQRCSYYSFAQSARLAIAVCEDKVAQGAVNGPLTTIPITDNQDLLAVTARLLQDEQRMIVEQSHAMVGGFQTTLFRKAGGEWVVDADLTAMLMQSERLGTFARDPAGHDLSYVAGGAYVRELVFDGTWHEGTMVQASDLGVTSVDDFAVTSDGLRAVFYATGSMNEQAMYYTDRMTTGSAFRRGDLLAGVPRAIDAFMTDDCGRIYVSGLGSIFFAQPQ
jgi:hypothetical protein